MKYIKGLYMTLVLMMFINLLSTTVFNDKYSGITMFISLGIFIIGSAFFVNAKRLNINEKE